LILRKFLPQTYPQETDSCDSFQRLAAISLRPLAISMQVLLPKNLQNKKNYCQQRIFVTGARHSRVYSWG
jgi:hypothetical protein